MSNFSSYAVGRSDPGQSHFTITPGASALNPRPRAIYANTAGTVTVEDATGVSVVYNVLAGQVLPFSAVKITAATATVIGWV